MMTEEADTRCVAVFTARSPGRILSEGGSQAWVLDPARVRALPFLVCVQNQNNPDRDFSDASEPHGAAFLIGRISDVVPSSEDPTSGRWKIQIREFALIANKENTWKGWRNPVKYTTLKEMGVDLNQVDWVPVEEIQQDIKRLLDQDQKSTESAGSSGKLSVSMSDAKLGLATYYGVPPENIEIVIRG